MIGKDYPDSQQWADRDDTVYDDRDHAASGDTKKSEPPKRKRVRLTAASEIVPRQTHYMWDDRIPDGVIGLWAGREGIGKSLGAAWLTAQLTNGTLPGLHYGTPRTVIYSAAEDSWAHVLVPRLIAAKADRTKVFRIDSTVDDSTDGLPISLPADLNELEDSIREVSAAAVILDPLFSVLSSTLDTKDERKLRIALDPLKAIADRNRCTIIGIVHFNKGVSSDVSDRIQGARGFSNVTRSTTAFARLGDDEDDDGNVGVLSTTKNSYGRDYRSGLASLTYTIDVVTVATADGPAKVGRLRFTGETDRSVSDTLGQTRSGEDDEDAQDVRGWLHNYLARQGGAATPENIHKAGRAAGYSPDQLKRAKTPKGEYPKVYSRKCGMNDGWVWSLEKDTPEGGEHGSQNPEGSAKGAKSAPPSQARPSPSSALPSDARTAQDCCRDCLKSTEAWIMATRDGRCITCAASRREAS